MVGSQAIFPGVSVHAYSVSRSAANAFVANAAATWSLVSKTGGVVDGDLVPAGDGKSAIFTAHSPGSAVISATISGLTATTSGVITVNSAPTTISGTGSASVARVAGNQGTLLTVAVTPAGNPPSTGITVTANLSAFAGSATTQLYDDGTHGDVTAGDGIYSLSLTIPPDQAGGSLNIPVSVSDVQGRTGTSSISLTVLGSFTIFHTNDTHARITPHKWIVPAHGPGPDVFQEVGGAAYMAGEMLSLTSTTPNALVLDGGDMSEGNPIGDFDNVTVNAPGNAGVVGFFQLLSNKLKAQRGRGIDAWVVGNHDVRFKAYIDTLKNQTDFPVISINVCQPGTKTPYFQPYVIVTINGTKVGVVGYTTESSQVGPDLSSTLAVVPCDWSSGNSSYIHLADIVNNLRNTQGCDVVILLTHDGHADLCTQTTGKSNGPILADTTAAKLPEIAITGHWHTWCETVWEPSVLNYKTIFMEASSFIKYIGELKVTGSGKYISSSQHPLINSQITPDADVANYVQQEKDLYNSKTTGYTTDQILGYTADDLVLDKRMKWWSADEYPWTGDDSADAYICDGLKWKAAQLFGSCDLSIEVGGGVRSDIAAGAMTYTNIYEMYPWTDDLVWMVKMKGQEIWNFIQDNNCDVGISREWHVTAVDGKITSLTYNGNPVNLTATYNVSISNYIYNNNTFTDTNPSTSNYVAREALMEYAQLFPQSTPYAVGGPRYTLNTDFSGGYRAVVTMMNDNDTRTVFDDGFIRMLSATPETLARRGSPQVPTSFVNADGSVNHSNRLSEIELYRSFLGFKTGMLKPGDIIETYGKGGFFGGDPEFVDQEGVQADGVEMKIVGHDASLAQPEYYSSIGAFYNDTFKNHYVKFFARKTAPNTVSDSLNTTLTVMDVTGFTAKSLPGKQRRPPAVDRRGHLRKLRPPLPLRHGHPRLHCRRQRLPSRFADLRDSRRWSNRPDPVDCHGQRGADQRRQHDLADADRRRGSRVRPGDLELRHRHQHIRRKRRLRKLRQRTRLAQVRPQRPAPRVKHRRRPARPVLLEHRGRVAARRRLFRQHRRLDRDRPELEQPTRLRQRDHHAHAQLRLDEYFLFLGRHHVRPVRVRGRQNRVAHGESGGRRLDRRDLAQLRLRQQGIRQQLARPADRHALLRHAGQHREGSVLLSLFGRRRDLRRLDPLPDLHVGALHRRVQLPQRRRQLPVL